MKKFIVSEEEKIRIINLHKKLMMEQSYIPIEFIITETEGEVSSSFFETNNIGSYPSEATTTTNTTTSSGCKVKPCPPVTDANITQKFEDEANLKQYPGDTRWRYIKIENDWYAKRIDGDKVFNITKCECTSSVDKLNVQFP